MIRLIDLTAETGRYRRFLPRADFDMDDAVARVRPICDEVATRGSEALAEFSAKFDQVVPESFRVPAEVLSRAAAELDPQLAKAFELSIARRREVCQQLELEPASRTIELAPGARITQSIRPVDRVGLYVPGGLAPLASSVIMNVIPAQIAGVGSLAVASPPQKDFGGWPHPSILALCHLLGVDEVYAVGGAQAIAMFAHGVEGVCEPVDLVTGPGNIYVVAAKRALKGLIGIDSEAGPTEILILADDTANPSYVAADLISQAEHDPSAASVLVTDSAELVEQVRIELQNQTQIMKHHERIDISLGGLQSAIVLVRDLEQGIVVANAYGAEHLEIHTRDPQHVATRISNAGAIFVGSFAPVSLGDYSAGSTHVLPTAGTARHSSGLNVRSFMRSMHIIDYSKDALGEVAQLVETFALAENLPGHANAITVRGN